MKRKRHVHYHGAHSAVQVHPTATRHTWKLGSKSTPGDAYFYAPGNRGKAKRRIKKEGRLARKLRIAKERRLAKKLQTLKPEQRSLRTKDGIPIMSWGEYQRLNARYGKHVQIPGHR